MSQTNPRKTFGHHFTDLLACPQKAWLRYHGDSKQKLPPPPYLLILQREGLEIEQKVYLERYPNAIKISSSPKTRFQETMQAMRDGHSAILQGYLETIDGAGVIDILEFVGPNPDSLTKNDYQVGEIKRSLTLKTAHVLQAAWYTDLLARVCVQNKPETFFILGSGQTEFVQLDDYWSDYEQTRTELFLIRDSQDPPGAHLNIACPSCDWRGVCMPQLIASGHLSLLPGLSRKHIETLQAQGITSWKDFPLVADEFLESLGFTPYEVERLRRAFELLSNGLFPLKQELQRNVFSNGQITTVEFEELSGQTRSGQRNLSPKVIHLEVNPGQVRSIQIEETASGIFQADISSLMEKDLFIFYGSTDLMTFKQIVQQNVGKFNIKLVDILSILETYLHAPLLGLDIDTLVGEIQSSSPQRRYRGAERVEAIRIVVDWFNQVLE